MHDNSPLLTKTAGSSATVAQEPKGIPKMMTSWKVDSATYDELIFLKSTQRKKFVDDPNTPHREKPQETTKEGVPVWTVTLYCKNWFGGEGQIWVNVPSSEDPADRFSRGEVVAISDVLAGVTPKRNGGFRIWMRATAIEAATGATRKLASAGAAA